jgi:hypothetical protein
MIIDELSSAENESPNDQGAVDLKTFLMIMEKTSW